jgi:uncharacterized repeat protein (TIGR01451 family)
LADNSGRVLLNGTQIGDAQPLTTDFSNFDGTVDFSAESSDGSLFHAGSNDLSFEVTDISDGTGFSPTGVGFAATVVYGPSDPGGLGQATLASDAIAIGGNTDHTDVVLSGDVTDPDSEGVSLEVEVQTVSTEFTGEPTGTSDPVASGGNASVTVPNLATDTNYHWQARTVDDKGLTSNWVSFGGNSDGDSETDADTDFRVPEADLSISKSDSPDPVKAGTTLTYTIDVANNDDVDTATSVKVADVLPTLQSLPLLTNVDISVSPGTADCGTTNAFDCHLGSIDAGDTVTVTVTGTVNIGLRHGSLSTSNSASVSSPVHDPDLDNNDSGNVSTAVHTVPDQVSDTTYDVQAGNTNAVVSWEPLTASQNGGETVDFYRISVSATPTGTGTGNFDVYPPSPTPPSGSLVATPCAGRLGGTLCFNLTGLTNSTTTPPTAPSVTYTVTIRAHNAVGLADARTRNNVVPSPNNNAVIVPPATAQTFSNCGNATTKTPICIVYTIPSGGGGAFSSQALADSVSQCQSLGGTLPQCTGFAALASFEGHPPAGYAPTKPLMIQVTWDVTITNNTIGTVYYQKDGAAPKPVAACKKSGLASPDPCLKAIKTLGKSTDTQKSCKPQSSCYGDVQAQILLSSNPTDGGIYHKT